MSYENLKLPEGSDKIEGTLIDGDDYSKGQRGIFTPGALDEVVKNKAAELVPIDPALDAKLKDLEAKIEATPPAHANPDLQEGLTRDEMLCLLYLESRAVDHAGRVATEGLNAPDREIMERWNESGFVESGRIIAADCNKYGSIWCKLSAEAHAKVSSLRVLRANRQWAKRTYTTTKEKAEE